MRLEGIGETIRDSSVVLCSPLLTSAGTDLQQAAKERYAAAVKKAFKDIHSGFTAFVKAARESLQ